MRKGPVVLCLISLLAALPAAAMPHNNCVKFVQAATGMPVRGDAWEWWAAAPALSLGRGHTPLPGAVLVFARSTTLPHGHVAVVRRVNSPREILVDHANWQPGELERGVAVVDVSSANDWSQVRVWYRPAAEVGQRVYPAYGFVYET